MRQNIDEKWKTDPRRTALAKRIGGRAADGMRVEVNWLLLDHRGKPVPLKEFQFIDNWQDWIECGLAEVDGEFVRIAGADAYAEFFAKQKENGQRGGRPRNPKKPNVTQINPNKPKLTQKKPENPSSSISSSVSISISSSSSNEFPSETPKSSAFVAAYCSRFKARWGINPLIQGKDAGIAKRLAKTISLERFEFLLDAFFEMPDSWLVKNKHPLGFFETKLNEVTVFADSGKFTTQTQARQADNMATNELLLRKLQEENR